MESDYGTTLFLLLCTICTPFILYVVVNILDEILFPTEPLIDDKVMVILNNEPEKLGKVIDKLYDNPHGGEVMIDLSLETLEKLDKLK